MDNRAKWQNRIHLKSPQHVLLQNLQEPRLERLFTRMHENPPPEIELEHYEVIGAGFSPLTFSFRVVIYSRLSGFLTASGRIQGSWIH